MKGDVDPLRACYNILLGREPDEIALANWGTAEHENSDLRGMLATILNSSEFALKWQDLLLQKAGSTDATFFNEQSQFGEVGRLLRQMVNASAVEKLVVDVGANGRERSNSYDLMKYFGWKGLLIEANPHRSPIIHAEFAGLDYRLVTCAVSDYQGEATFHLGINDDVSSLQVEAANGWGPVRGEVKVTVRPLHSILAEHDIPKDFDLLSIDAEGEDVKILNDTILHSYRPRWVILEAVHDQSAPRLDRLGLSDDILRDYRIVDTTVANLILQRV